MSLELPEVESALREALLDIGLEEPRVLVRRSADEPNAVTVSITSASFNGQSYLDREMRVRPAVARVILTKYSRSATYVIDPLAPDEEPLGDATAFASGGDADGGEASGSEPERTERRKEWRETCRRVLGALGKSNYEVEELDEGVIYVAQRSGLGSDRIIVSFAVSPNSRTVHLETRNRLQGLVKTRGFKATYYITPETLDAPFANQTKASWLSTRSVHEFLSELNASDRLAAKVREVCRSEQRKLPKAERGSVVEPSVRLPSGDVLDAGFFEYVQEWAGKEGPSLLVLYAPAGHGKTTLVQELSRRFAENYIERHSGPVPAFVGFESVRRTVDFEALLHKQFLDLKAGSLGAFAELLRKNEAVLLVDGFDELADDGGPGVAEAQILSMRSLFQGSAKVVLAGRSVFTQEFAGGRSLRERMRSLLGDVAVTTLEVLPFSQDQVDTFVDTREGLDGGSKAAVKSFARSGGDHGELAGNPLFLRLLCSLASTGKMPSPDRVDEGLDLLLQSVCLREETRQQLGLGVSAQIEYLTWVAVDVFKALIRQGRGTLHPDDVRVIATLLLDERGYQGQDVVGRLVDHAVFTTAPNGHVHFIHPYIRDVLISRALEAGPAAAGTPLDIGDLPEGTVQHFGRTSGGNLAAGFFAKLPDGWVSVPGRFTVQTRRNLFRLCVAAARHKRSGDPRRWVQTSWLDGEVVKAFKLDDQVLESISMGGLKWVDCSFENSLLDECDLRFAQFEGCSFRSATLYECLMNNETSVNGGDVASLTVGDLGKVETLPSLNALLEWLLKRYGKPARIELNPARTGPSKDAVTAGRRLLRLALGLLTSTDDGGAKFFALGKDNFLRDVADLAEDASERAAMSKVVGPAVVSSLCSVELRKGSVEMVEIEKRWRTAALSFLGSGRGTPAFEEVASKIVVRAARHL